MGSRFLRTSVQVLRKMANVGKALVQSLLEMKVDPTVSERDPGKMANAGKALVQSLVEMKVDPTVSERDSGNETAPLRSKSSTSPSKHILTLLTHLVR